MVICFQASPDAQIALARLQSTGRYPDVSAAISAAICNLEVLDTAVRASPDAIYKPGNPESRGPEATVATGAALLKKPIEPYESDRFSVAMDAPPTPTDPISPRDWPWGQFNKILPVKVTCRATLNLLLQNPSIKVADAATAVARAAADLGARLEQADVASHRRRDEAFAAAFPTVAEPDDKAFMRFTEQFTFGTGSFAETSYPQVLGLVRLVDGAVRLTVAGLKFAELANPVLDGDFSQSSERFSSDELSFLREHILTQVPAERSALVAVLTAVKQGAVNPEAVDAFLRQMLPQHMATVTAPLLATQRTGAISRAVELKLLRRERQGVRVTYLLEPAASLFIP